MGHPMESRQGCSPAGIRNSEQSCREPGSSVSPPLCFSLCTCRILFSSCRLFSSVSQFTWQKMAGSSHVYTSVLTQRHGEETILSLSLRSKNSQTDWPNLIWMRSLGSRRQARFIRTQLLLQLCGSRRGKGNF